MAGLVSSSMPETSDTDILGNKIQTANMSTFSPETRAINPENETVSGQLDQILKQDNPYVARRRSSADGVSNARGLINSTMGVQAGEAAAIDAALPIAQQNASIYGQASKDNMDATNTALQFNAGSKNQGAQFNASAQNQFTKAEQDAAIQKEAIASTGEQQRQTQAAGSVQQKELQASGAAFESALQQVKGDQATNLANIEANYRTLIQASASAQTFFTAMSNNISAVLANTDTTAEQKQSAVDKITQVMNNGLTVIGSISNLDLAGLLDFSGA